MPKRRRESLDESAWIAEAFEVLSEQSIDGVGIESLAKRLGVTKGSFYWHFKDRAALLNAILREWRQRATLAIIDRLEHSGASIEERLRRLMEGPQSTAKSRKGALVELAIRGWARKDRLAAQAVTDVDQQRLRYLQSLCEGLGCPPEEAKVRAFLLYAVQFGDCLIKVRENEAERTTRRARLTKSVTGSDIFSKADKRAAGAHT